MNNKGFTLIELLVTIVIMALILIVVMPSITALVNNNENRSYEYYGDALVEAAKIYVNREGEDISPLGIDNWIGCVDISYDELINSDLIDPITLENTDCSDAKVRYTKSRKSDSYSYNMTCKDTTSNEVVYEHKDIPDEVCSQTEDVRATTISGILLEYVKEHDNYNDDGTTTYITGSNPNNYIWYSGKLWRAIGIDNTTNNVKMITVESMTEIPYNASGTTNYDGSYAESWLNDTSSTGFLGNLRDYESFIQTDSVWNTSTVTNSSYDLDNTSSVINAIGLINSYDYKMTFNNDTDKDTFLPSSLVTTNYTSNSSVCTVNTITNCVSSSPSQNKALYPVVNLFGDIEVTKGTGSENNPYRLEGDSDENLTGTLLNTRYSGEYVNFGVGTNSTYRLVYNGTDGSATKIVSADNLRNPTDGSDIEMFYGSTYIYTSSDLYTFLNNDFLNPDNGYLSSADVNMITSGSWNSTTIEIGDGGNYTTSFTGGRWSNSNQIGIPMLGELGTFGPESQLYWINTAYQIDIQTAANSYVRVAGANELEEMGASTCIDRFGNRHGGCPGVRPTLYLNANVTITSGEGTKTNPFVISLS